MLTLNVTTPEQQDKINRRIETLELLIQQTAAHSQLQQVSDACLESVVTVAATACQADLGLADLISDLRGELAALSTRNINLALSLIDRSEEIYAYLGVTRIEDKLRPGKFILCPNAPKAAPAPRKAARRKGKGRK